MIQNIINILVIILVMNEFYKIIQYQRKYPKFVIRFEKADNFNKYYRFELWKFRYFIGSSEGTCIFMIPIWKG